MANYPSCRLAVVSSTSFLCVRLELAAAAAPAVLHAGILKD